ncbi:MAG: MucR family transcriptional regulator [Pseudomonadota bacterium]
MVDAISKTELFDMTTAVVSSFVSNNPLSSADLPELVIAVHGTLASLAYDQVETTRLDPAVPIKKSVTYDHIICLEDGAKLKMLKRYLRKRYNLTPEEYRARWGLPFDYPMVAPEYAKRRSEFARKIGLGKNQA